MATLSREQTAQLAYQAGFRGQALMYMTAIPQRESGYRTDAMNPNGEDTGLWQMNWSAHGQALVNAGIVNSQQDLFDPVLNARAAFYRSGGTMAGIDQMWGAGPGGWQGPSGDPLYGTDYDAAVAAVQNAERQGLLGQDWNEGGSPNPGGGGGGGGGSGNAPSQPAATLPSDSRVVKTEMGLFVVFNPSPGVFIHYVVPWAEGTVDTSGHDVDNMSHSAFAKAFPKSIGAGSAVELGNLSMTFGTFGRFWNSLLDQVFGRGNPARDDPGVLRAIAEYASRPDMDPVELENILKGTRYWRQRTDAERIWNDLSPADQKKQRQDMLGRMAETWYQFHGRQMNWNDPFMKNWVEDLASGKTSYSLFTRRVRELARLNPESPWSRETRDEQEAQRQRGIDIENTAERVRGEALRWGLQWKEPRIQKWAEGIVEKRMSDQDLMDQLRDLASVRYPGKPNEMDTESWAENYTQSFEQLMEKSTDLFNPWIQKALKRGMNLHDFESELKNRPAWLSTKNADAAMHATLTRVGEMFGMA